MAEHAFLFFTCQYQSKQATVIFAHLMEKNVLDQIREATSHILKEQGIEVSAGDVLVSTTRKDFEGDLTVVIFPFVKAMKKSPPEVGEWLGAALQSHLDSIAGYNVVQGFLNLTLSSRAWFDLLVAIKENPHYGTSPRKDQKALIEFCSPNTNKPLHLGHIRNILLGWSCSRILHAAGWDVVKIQIINDRGIAICKSMLAWKLYGEGETPESSGTKGDFLVGKYYVLFNDKLTLEYDAWQESVEGRSIHEEKAEAKPAKEFFNDFKNTYFNSYSELGKQAREMLIAWEKDDPEVRSLWTMMNGWVYQGFDETFAALGVRFDQLYYESETWVEGKEQVLKGLQQGIFVKKEDGSIWVDLTDRKMDEKILLRSDGTAVYITQDIGTAMQRYRDHHADAMVYVVGDEQNYHFKVLFEILKKLGEPYADALFHLSYGMVELPSGKMKGREGTIVEADDLMRDVISEARAVALEKGEIATLTEVEQTDAFRKIGLAALKFFMLKINPQKRMVFDPSASVDLQGQTGPYVQNAYVRIKSVLRKAEEDQINVYATYTDLADSERQLLQLLAIYPEVISKAAREYDPSGVANFCYDMAKNYHRFYHDLKILGADTEDARNFRLNLSASVAQVLAHAMDLLGIEMPEKM